MNRDSELSNISFTAFVGESTVFDLDPPIEYGATGVTSWILSIGAHGQHAIRLHVRDIESLYRLRDELDRKLPPRAES